MPQVVETLKEKLNKLTPAAAEPALGCSSQTLWKNYIYDIFLLILILGRIVCLAFSHLIWIDLVPAWLIQDSTFVTYGTGLSKATNICAISGTISPLAYLKELSWPLLLVWLFAPCLLPLPVIPLVINVSILVQPSVNKCQSDQMCISCSDTRIF